MRSLLALLAGVAVTFGSAVILGEYTFNGPTPYAAAAGVPIVVVSAMIAIDAVRRLTWWRVAGPLGAVGLALGVWFSTGRAAEPVPVAAYVAVALGLVWPLLVAELMRRRHVAVKG
ncbi:MAG: hypothetical protein ACRDYC_02615 [Acidimicrobiales bacterium]